MTKYRPYLAIGLAVISWLTFMAGWAYSEFAVPSNAPFIVAAQKNWAVFRVVGFAFGGTVSFITLLLCGYYYWFHSVRCVMAQVAIALSGVYVVVFSAFLIDLFLRGPLALNWFL